MTTAVWGGSTHGVGLTLSLSQPLIDDYSEQAVHAARTDRDGERNDRALMVLVRW